MKRLLLISLHLSFVTLLLLAGTLLVSTQRPMDFRSDDSSFATDVWCLSASGRVGRIEVSTMKGGLLGFDDPLLAIEDRDLPGQFAVGLSSYENYFRPLRRPHAFGHFEHRPMVGVYRIHWTFTNVGESVLHGKFTSTAVLISIEFTAVLLLSNLAMLLCSAGVRRFWYRRWQRLRGKKQPAGFEPVMRP